MASSNGELSYDSRQRLQDRLDVEKLKIATQLDRYNKAVISILASELQKIQRCPPVAEGMKDEETNPELGGVVGNGAVVLGATLASAKPEFDSPSLLEQARGDDTNGCRRLSFDTASSLSNVHLTHQDSLPFVDTRKTHGLLRAIVNSPWFEAFFVAVILINTLISALQAQYDGFDVGLSIDYPGYSETAENIWPAAKEIFRTLEVLFAAMYTVELGMKMLSFRCHFWRDAWNVFDFTIVALWYVTECTGVHFGNPTILRLCRLARLMRLVRHVGWFQSFDSLHMLISAIASSKSVLVWSSMILCTLLVISALVMNGLLFDYLRGIGSSEALDAEMELRQRREVYEYFGTFSRALISMFEISFASHVQVSRTILENVGEGYVFFFLVYKLLVGLSVMKVITGVFLHETFKVCSEDDDLMVIQKRRAMKEHMKKMNKLFERVDADDDGCLIWEEFENVMNNNEWLRSWIGAMELDTTDAKRLFRLLDDGDGHITADELVKGVTRLKGVARSVDMNHMELEVDLLKQEVSEMHSKIMTTHKEMSSRIDAATAGGLNPSVGRQQSSEELTALFKTPNTPPPPSRIPPARNVHSPF